jgi:predicted branched-subunit amino acid permease
MWRGTATALPWAASGLVAAAVHAAVPGPWYVAAGALSGLVVAVVAARPEEAVAGA